MKDVKVGLPLDNSNCKKKKKRLFLKQLFFCLLLACGNDHAEIFRLLVITDKYNDFIDANRIEDAEDRLKTMKKLVCVKGQQIIER